MKRKGVLRYKENTKIIEYSLNINLSVVATKITFQFLSGMYCFAKSTGQSNLLSLSRQLQPYKEENLKKDTMGLP